MRTEHILFSGNGALKGFQAPYRTEIVCSFLRKGRCWL